HVHDTPDPAPRGGQLPHAFGAVSYALTFPPRSTVSLTPVRRPPHVPRHVRRRSARAALRRHGDRRSPGARPRHAVTAARGPARGADRGVRPRRPRVALGVAVVVAVPDRRPAP